jgi:hypothetical protein
VSFPFRRSARPSWPSSSNRSCQRRIVRGVTPMISAAITQLIFFAIAFNSTSCSFIVRSISAGICSSWAHLLGSRFHRRFSKRTDHALIRADKSHVNHNSLNPYWTMPTRRDTIGASKGGRMSPTPSLKEILTTYNRRAHLRFSHLHQNDLRRCAASWERRHLQHR